MASLIFAKASSALTKAKKAARAEAENLACLTGRDEDELYKEKLEHHLNMYEREFEQTLEFASRLHDTYKAFMNKTPQSYFITIRPDCNQCSLSEFMCKVKSFVERKCFISYTLSYEQKGTSDETIGQGFHVHIVAEMRQRSKTEVIRDVMSSWNGWIKDSKIKSNCIQVDVTRNPTSIVNKYLIEYESEDGHKEVTKEWDAKWRQQNNIDEIYRS